MKKIFFASDLHLGSPNNKESLKREKHFVKWLNSIKNEELLADYPENKFDKPVTNQYLLLHLISHLTYHIGQINYHRRLLH